MLYEWRKDSRRRDIRFILGGSQSVPLCSCLVLQCFPPISMCLCPQSHDEVCCQCPALQARKKSFVVFGCYDKLCGRWWFRVCHNHSVHSWCVCVKSEITVTWLQMRTPAVNNSTFPPRISLENSFHNCNFSADSKDRICFAISASSIWTATHCHTEIMPSAPFSIMLNTVNATNNNLQW